MHRSTAVAALILCQVSYAAAATKTKDLPPFYRTWLTKDAVYIITEDERKQFLSLDNDAARDEFIESFWSVRNPQRGSKTNPYKEEHYRRLEYATSHFGRQSNTPGWMTDQGRTWILFGKPESAHKFTGYGQIYPLDLWFYQNNNGNPSIPSFFYLLFYIPEDIGEYKFYRPGFEGPMKLVRGSQFHSNRDVYNFLKPLGGDVAHSAFSLIPNDPIDTTDYTADMGSDILINKILNSANDPFNIKRIREARALSAKVSSFFLVQQEKKLDISSIVLTDPLGHYWLDYALLIDEPRLGQAAGKDLKLTAAYHLYNEKGDLIVEDSEDRAYPAFDGAGAEAKFVPFVLANRLPVEPGAYRLDVEINNREAGRTYKGEQKISVGPGKQAAFSGPLTAGSIDKVGRPDPVTPFQYFGIQFHPTPNRVFNRRQTLRVLFELQQPANSLGAAPGDWQVEYVVANVHDREARQKSAEDVPASAFSAGKLLKSKTIALEALEVGDYRLVLNLRPAGSSEVTVSVNLPIKLQDEAVDQPLFFSNLARGLASPGVAAYIRGLEAISQKNGNAPEYLAQALQENPANAYAGQLLIQNYFQQKKYAEITALYKRLGVNSFKASAETLAQISLSFWQTGERGQAKDLIDAANQYFPGNQLVAQTRSRYNSAPAK